MQPSSTPGNMMYPPSMADIPLSADMVSQVPSNIQKQMLGERLFPMIAKLQPELAGKVSCINYYYYYYYRFGSFNLFSIFNLTVFCVVVTGLRIRCYCFDYRVLWCIIGVILMYYWCNIGVILGCNIIIEF